MYVNMHDVCMCGYVDMCVCMLTLLFVSPWSLLGVLHHLGGALCCWPRNYGDSPKGYCNNYSFNVRLQFHQVLLEGNASLVAGANCDLGVPELRLSYTILFHTYPPTGL